MNLDKISKDIQQETDKNRLKDLTDLFNLSLAKRNAIRVLKLYKLLDNIDNELITRFETSPAMFSNSDLLDYLNAIQKSIELSNQAVTNIKENPVPQIQQNVQVNIVDSLSRESRERISEAVKILLNQVNNGEKVDG